MNWIEAIFSRLAELWPFVKVHSYQQGVRFRCGKDVARCAPGVHFAFWWFEEIMVVDVVEQSINLPTQSVTTHDNVAVTFSANILYEVEDARVMYTSVQDFDDSLTAAAMNHLAQKVRAWSWDELVDGQRDLEKSLKGTLSTRAARWGVKITDVAFTDMARARVYRWYGDPMMG